jgi:amino acid permease
MSHFEAIFFFLLAIVLAYVATTANFQPQTSSAQEGQNPTSLPPWVHRAWLFGFAAIAVYWGFRCVH